MGGLRVGLRRWRFGRGRCRGVGLGVRRIWLLGWLVPWARFARRAQLLWWRLGCGSLRRGRRRFAGGWPAAVHLACGGNFVRLRVGLGRRDRLGCGACATGAGCAGSAGSVSGAVVVMRRWWRQRSAVRRCRRVRAVAASPRQKRRRRQPDSAGNGRRMNSAGAGIATDGIGLPAASCSGAAPVASRLNGSWLTRKVANMAKPQLSATTEATTAAIKRRTLGNIRPRITAARSSAKHASLRCRSSRGQMAPPSARLRASSTRYGRPTGRRPTARDTN